MKSSEVISLRLLWVGLVTLSFAVVARGQPRGQTSIDYLYPHNAARQALDLVWNDILATYATDWASSQASMNNCAVVHSGGPYGENIYYWSGGASLPGDAVQAWVDEAQYYDYASNTCQAGQDCSYYTQVVWKNTLRVGCGSAICADGCTFIVCSYNPPGNYVGQWPY